jgi:polygalacturonase
MKAFLAAALTLAMSLSVSAAGLTINVKDAGAVGDGVADDTAALQKALSGGQRTVVIPAGTYRIATALQLESETTIQADAKAIIRLADQAGNDVGLFVLTNRDFTGGDHDIIVDGGVWDGNNEHNARGTKEQIPCSTGVAINFINVRKLTLRNLTVRNPDAYAIRACRITDFLFENIGFDFSILRPNQDGIHLNGFCERGIIRNLRALSPYATNDDMVALNADDGAPTDYAPQQGMVNGPIRDIIVEHLRAESAFTFVRVLSHRQVIENITISDVVGGCRFYAVNMDRWKFPAGAGKIRNVTFRDFDVRKMPDVFSKQKGAGQRPLIHIQSAVEGLRIENFRRQENDEAGAVTLSLDNEQQNRVRLAGLDETQIAALTKASPEVMANGSAISTDSLAKITLPSGGFTSLSVDAMLAKSGAENRKEVFKESPEWRPIQWEPARIVKGSALDFSSRLETPAGKFGEVVIRDGHFVFANAPEKELRLYGAVVSHSLPYLDKAQCERLADYLAATGYSGIRLHNYTFAKGVLKEPGSTEFTPEARDQLDYFLSCLKQRGLYFSFPINSWGFFKAGDVTDVPEFRDRAFRFESNGLLPISADLQRWFRDYAVNLLTHVNPYTGLALKDEPALISLELTNENSLLAVLGQHPELLPIYRRKCAEHLKATTGQDPTPERIEKELPRFVEDLQVKFFETMKAFLRSSGIQKPLTDLNFRDNMVYAAPRSKLDYVDVHTYWALYQTLPKTEAGAEPAFRHTWVNPNSVGWSYYLGGVPSRIFGKPYVNTEFNGCFPTPYWSFTGPVEAVLAGTQGWDAVFRCGLAADGARFFSAQPMHQIATSSSPAMMLSERIGALLFAQGEIKPLPVRVPMVVTPEYLFAKATPAGGPKFPPSYSQLTFDYQLGTVVLEGQEQLDGYPCVVVPPDMELPQSLKEKKVLRADATLAAEFKRLFPATNTAGRLERDAQTSAAKIVTPRAETFLLPADVAEAHGGNVRISGNQSVATCFAGSLDGQPLASSKRILALYLTDMKNTGTEVEYEPSDKVIVHHEGKLPLLMRQGNIEMAFRLDQNRSLPKVWALKYDGSRATKLEPRRTPEGYSFTAQAVTNAQIFSAFELTWAE